MNKFRNSQGTRYTSSLFLERVGEDKTSCVYTLREEDHLGYPSLYKLYLQTEDLTEYTFAMQHLDGWSHWEALKEAEWFKPYIERWRRELATLLESRHLAKVQEIADGDGKDRLTAARYLLERAEKAAGAKTRGRPTKAASQAELNHRASEAEWTTEDLKRLGLN